MSEIKKCETCGREYDPDECLNHSGQICDSCDEIFTKCIICEEWVERDSTSATDYGDVCEDCEDECPFAEEA